MADTTRVTIQRGTGRCAEIKRHDGTPLKAGDIVAGQIVEFDPITLISDAGLNRKQRRARRSSRKD